MSEPISELAFHSLPQAVRDWIQELGWKREEIISFHVQYGIIKTNASDEEWAKWRRGKHADVTAKRSVEDVQCQRFTRLSDIDWQKVQ